MNHFEDLLPTVILDAVQRQGVRPRGSLFPLNSYENRVYTVDLEEQEPIVAKFYRPGRWSAEAIAEEHRFVVALADAEVPVVEPLILDHPVPECDSLGKTGDYYYAFFPKFRGREHDEITDVDRAWMGKVLARMHRVGEAFPLSHRPRLDPETYGYESLEFILGLAFIPADLREGIESVLERVLALVEPYFPPDLPAVAVHGDCHPGNILWNPEGPHLVDFDDMLLAPAVQDIWMLFSGTADEQERQRRIFFENYETFRPFDGNSLALVEPLRTLRIIRHAAWIGQRYAEPAFQRAFPYYRERRYWEEFLNSLKEQISLLQSA